MKIKEQEEILKNNKKNMLVSASAGSGKTYIMIKYICQLICEEKIPVKDFLVLTFTKAAATEMKERLQNRLKENGADEFVVEQIDSLSTSNISTIHAFCEKFLKKYANLLDLNENFEIADESLSQKIRQTAFEKALKVFQKQSLNEFDQLMLVYKNDKNKLRNILFEIEKLLNSVADKEEFLSRNICKSQEFFDKALEYLHKEYSQKLNDYLREVEKLHVNDFQEELEELLFDVLNANNFFEMAKLALEFKFPNLPKKKDVGDDVVENLNVLKKNINKIVEKIKELNVQDESNVNFQRDASLEKLVLNFYDLYEKEEENLKKSQNLLDFYDLEKYMKILSKKQNLFDGIKYVFVDEYQDTNKAQERIIKNVAKNCNFVAVGDVKQGIYGFRLASSEIFLKDVEDFEQDEKSSVNYLKSNFRSSQKVLDFINEIFKVCMTKELTGVDYEKSSMLVGRSQFLDDGQKAVTLDLVSENEDFVVDLPEIYSVKEAGLFVDNKNQNMIFAIVKRIVEVLSSKISEQGVLRPCRYSDIAILARKRDDLFNELEIFLQKIGIPVVSTSRSKLMEEPELQMLRNYLKIALNLDDDIALLSVLLSNLSDVSLKEVLEEKQMSEKSLCEIVKETKNEKIIEFLKNLKDFRENSLIFGIKKAFLELFNKTNYRACLNMKSNHQRLNNLIDKFLNEISSSGFEFDLAGLIDYFETVEISVSTDASAVEDAVLLTTIHNSKGLEYPVVFLIGCDQSMKKTMPKAEVEIDENFGLALKQFDLENNNEIMTVKMRAIREFESKKSFVEELMIFYVALTRAKNRLYLFGTDKSYQKFSIKDCDSYYDLIFYALNLDGDEFENETLRVCKVESLEETQTCKKQSLENVEIDKDFLKICQDYLSFKYMFDDAKNFRLKESVTSINQKNLEDKLTKFSNENFAFGDAIVEIGNAYHLALKTVDFEKIEDINSLSEEIKKNQEIFSGVEGLIDIDLLLQNILLLKPFCQNAKCFKEKEFILKDSVENLFNESQIKDQILVQGVIDFFAIRNGEGVLIDYKYSNSKNDNYLINKYINQLRIYKIALENALNIKINEVYLLSIKQKRLIKVEI